MASPAAQLLPGSRHRTSATFRSFNLSLSLKSPSDSDLTSVVEKEKDAKEAPASAPALQKSRSFRTTKSFTSLCADSQNTDEGRSQRLLSFVSAHKALLNILVRDRPALLEGCLGPLIRTTQLRPFVEFNNKRKFFTNELKKLRGSREAMGSMAHITLRRSHIFDDSFGQLREMATAEDWQTSSLRITFQGEEGIDAGGLLREWYLLVSQAMFNQNYALFEPTNDGGYQPSQLSSVNVNHLDLFKFVGRVVGKAIVDGQLMEAHFTRSFYKHMLGLPVHYTDLEAIDSQVFKSCKDIMEQPLADIGLEDTLTFAAVVERFGKMETVELIPNGKEIYVTEENKAEYVRLNAHHRMTSAIRSQIDNFLDGFYDLVPAELISLFSPAEVELLICGLPAVDVDDLQANTDYGGYRSSDSIIGWFWEEIKGYSKEEKAMFLQFVTGTSKVPLGGFAALTGMQGPQKFKIVRGHEPEHLPSAHTCYNQLDLPSYRSQQELHDKLLLAITEGGGFGFG